MVDTQSSRLTLSLIIVLLAVISLYTITSRQVNPLTDKMYGIAGGAIIIERSGNMTGRMPVNITASYDVADSQIKEKILDALRSDSYSDYSSLKSKVFDIINNGGDIIEINVYLENNSSETLVLVTGGPDCFGPGFTLHLPLDTWPTIETRRGEAVNLISLCQDALVKRGIDPGRVIHTTYYIAVSRDFEGAFQVNTTVCNIAGYCTTLTVHIPIDMQSIG
ncbi:MAG: hypothetical protein F7B78_04035 [Desulfurococcales archaeon]|nr:hypothetical protein [Desulfurococcales archaeon]